VAGGWWLLVEVEVEGLEGGMGGVEAGCSAAVGTAFWALRYFRFPLSSPLKSQLIRITRPR